MGQYGYSEIDELHQDEPKPPKKNSHIGFTLVWEGKATEFIQVIRLWSVVQDLYLKVETPPNPHNIALWVANEYIDWKYLRSNEKFKPLNSNNLREEKELMADEFMRSLRTDYYLKNFPEREFDFPSDDPNTVWRSE